MASEKVKKLVIIVLLGLLTVSAFFIRLKNFQSATAYSIDEVVYYRMAVQTSKDAFDYNTVVYGNELSARGRSLPEYFFQPLFKHPPVFTYLVTLSLKIFGESPVSASYVSILFGVLFIPLAYFLARLVFNWHVGLLAAILMWIDPISMICSQKIWMETTLAFFMVLSLAFYMYAYLRHKNNFYIYAGLVSGLATLTKYSGFLSTIIMFVFLFIYDRELRKNKHFIFSLIIPLICLIPWFVWNVHVYGNQYFTNVIMKLQPHAFSFLQYFKIEFALYVFIIFICLKLLFYKLKADLKGKNEAVEAPLKQRPFLNTNVILIFFLFIILLKEIIYFFHPLHLPQVSWASYGFPSDNTPFFYFRQMAKFSPLYILSFFALLYYLRSEQDGIDLITLSAGFILAFFIVWMNYQSRYILPAVPFLMVLLAGLLYETFQFISNRSNRLFRIISSYFYLILIGLMIFKTVHVNLFLSFPHNFCYF